LPNPPSGVSSGRVVTTKRLPPMAERRTLAVDIGGTGSSWPSSDQSRRALSASACGCRLPIPAGRARDSDQGDRDRRRRAPGVPTVSVGFSGGRWRDGRVRTAPNLGTEPVGPVRPAIETRDVLGKPVRVMDDADVQGYGAIRARASRCADLALAPAPSIPRRRDRAASRAGGRSPVGRRKDLHDTSARPRSPKRARRRGASGSPKNHRHPGTVVNFDHLYLGGGTPRSHLDLPPDVSTVPNTDGLTCGSSLGARKTRRSNAQATFARRRSPFCHPAPAAASPARLAPIRMPHDGRRAGPRNRGQFHGPPRACDCHVHVFGEARELPVRRPARYTPPSASADEAAGAAENPAPARGRHRPADVYGTDNSCTLDGMRRSASGAAGSR